MATNVYQIIRENDGTYTIEVTQEGALYFSVQGLKSEEEALERVKARESLTRGFDKWIRAFDNRRL